DIKSRDALYAELLKVDAESAERIGKNDQYRLERALSLVLSENKTMAAIRFEFAQKQRPLSEIYPVKKVGITCRRDRLRARIEKRTKSMLEEGLIEEVESLLQAGFRHTKALAAIGYKEVVA